MPRLLLFLLAALPLLSAAQKADIAPGDTLPPFSVTLSDGRTVTNADLKGRPAVIVFFNTACRDCRKELPAIQKLYLQQGTDIQYICISRGETAESVQAFWDKEKLSLPYSAQADRDVYNRFARRGIPRTYLTDGTCTVVAVFAEKVSRRKLKAATRKLLPGGGRPQPRPDRPEKN